MFLYWLSIFFTVNIGDVNYVVVIVIVYLLVILSRVTNGVKSN